MLREMRPSIPRFTHSEMPLNVVGVEEQYFQELWCLVPRAGYSDADGHRIPGLEERRIRLDANM